jgi:predicted kinase
MAGKLSFVQGLPRSGKSTFCDNWVVFRDSLGEIVVNNSLWNGESFLNNANPRIIISGDDFRHAIHGSAFNISAESLVFATMDTATKALLHRGFDVIIDETCTTEATLLRYLKIDVNATPIFVDTPESVCIERAIAAGKSYLVQPIKRMSRQLEKLRSSWDETVARLKDYVESRRTQDLMEAK